MGGHAKIKYVYMYIYIIIYIRKYGSTFYMGFLWSFCHILALWENLNFSFHFQFPLNLINTITKVGNMLKANDIWKKIKKSS